MRYSSSDFVICAMGGVDVAHRVRVLPADDLAVLDHALPADNTRVDRGNPAIWALGHS